ncbi:MAG: nitrophenyl compound nitroreductase subunit ArsF family protein [Candidatus Micrarchaeota archaeon]|nr:nitrophenyl compound nitroreductase subunit ArsF family protein [Candidatus Micrarchaeota archaeon]
MAESMNRISIVTSIMLLALLVLAGCTGNSEAALNTSNSQNNSTQLPNVSVSDVAGVEKVEIIHFHGTHQCNSCITVGNYAQETINTYFADELKSGKVTFAHINAELPENQELVAKYGVTSASLWIGVYDEAGFHKEQNVQVWYKISDKEEYMAYLKGIIEKRLNGDLS